MQRYKFIHSMLLYLDSLSRVLLLIDAERYILGQQTVGLLTRLPMERRHSEGSRFWGNGATFNEDRCFGHVFVMAKQPGRMFDS